MSIWLGILIGIAGIFLWSYLYSVNYTLGTIWWFFLFVLSIIILLSVKNRKTNNFFKKNKKWIILSISITFLLDMISTYYFAKEDLSIEMNVLQRWMIQFFGIYFGLIFMFLYSIFIILIFLSKLPKKISKSLFFVVIVLKILAIFINFFFV